MNAGQPSPFNHTFTSFSSVSHSVPSKSPLSSAIAAVRNRRSPAAQRQATPSLPSHLAQAHASPLSGLYDGSDDMGSEAGSSAPGRGGGDEYDEEDSPPSPSLASLARATSGESDAYYARTDRRSHRSAPSVSSTGSNASPPPSDMSPPATPLCNFTPLAPSTLNATAADFTTTQQQPSLFFKPTRRPSNSRIRHELPLCLPSVPDRLHHFTLYETRQRWYVIGSNLTRTLHRLLKIDRTTLTALSIDEDYTTYTTGELDSLLHMIHTGNAAWGGILSVRHCQAVIGFVRFLLGYYMYVVTSASEVGRLGAHIIYAVTGVDLLQVADSAVWEGSSAYKRSKATEAKYRGLFLSMDVTKYFYFSYTYQLTRTLQLNMIAGGEGRTSDAEKDMYVWNHCMRLKPLTAAAASSSSSKQPPADPLVMELDRADWCIHLVHGYFEQSTLSILGRPLTLTLISRRSRHYAGTRYLKRGINNRGQAANDVETEQILHDRSQGSAREGAYTAYVTMRASIPVHWTQESNAIIAQPAIVMQKLDPLHLSTRRHVEDVWRRYGSPLLVLNLVKQTEARKRESIIGAAFSEAVEWLNVWLEAQHKVDYHAWDFKKISKSSTHSLMDELTVIAHWALQRTGLFHSHPKCDAQRVRAADTVGLKPTRESLREWGVEGLPTRKAEKKRKAGGVSGQKAREAEMWERNRDGNSGREEKKDVLHTASRAAELSGSHTPMSAPFVLSSIREDGTRADDSPFSRTAHTAHSAHHSRHMSDDSAAFPLSSLAALSSSPSNLTSPSSFSSLSPHSSTRPIRNIAFLQRGVCRGNCVDSLDRTNAALYTLGKCALGYQLHALSLIPSPVADNFGAMGSVLLDMYERMGDAIAMQYGGSQMHRQVRKDQNNTNTTSQQSPHTQPHSKTVPVLFSSLNPLKSSSHKPAELLTSLVRHYHNSFQDVSKQDAINLFLGLYRPWERGGRRQQVGQQQQQGELWDLQSDYYLHNNNSSSSEEKEEEEEEAEEVGTGGREETKNATQDDDEEAEDDEEEEWQEEEEVEDDNDERPQHVHKHTTEASRRQKRVKSDRLIRYEDERWWKKPIEENEKLLGPFALPKNQLFSTQRSHTLSCTTPLTSATLDSNQLSQRSVSSPVRMLHQSDSNVLAIPPFSSSSLLPSSSIASTSSLSDMSTSSSAGVDGLTALAPSLSWVLSYGPLTALTEFDTLLAAQGMKGGPLHSITILGVDDSTAAEQRLTDDKAAAKQSGVVNGAVQQVEGGSRKRKSRRRDRDMQPPPSPLSPARAEWETQQSALRELYERRRKEALYSLDSSYALCRASPTVSTEVAAAYDVYVKQGVQSLLVPESSVHDSEWMLANWRTEKQDAREAVKRRAREKADDRRQRRERQQTAALVATHSTAAASTIVKESIGTAGLALASRKVSLAESDDDTRLPRLSSFVVLTDDGTTAAVNDDDDDQHITRTAPARLHPLTPPPHTSQPHARTDRQHSVVTPQRRDRGCRGEPLLSPLSDSSTSAVSPHDSPASPLADSADGWSGELSLPLSASQLLLFRTYVSYCTAHLQPSLWHGCFAAHVLEKQSIGHTYLHSVSDRQYRWAEEDVMRKFLSLS